MQVNNIHLVPSSDCWGNFEAEPDLAAAASLFLGKTRDDVAPLLKVNYIVRCLDLAEMPDCAFGYYAVGFAEFALHEASDDERFGVMLGAFLDAMSGRYIYSPRLCLDIWRQTIPLLEQLSERLSRGAINAETKNELMQELDKIHIALRTY